MTAIDKKLVERAGRERYIVLEMRVSEAQKEEKKEKEKTRNSMMRKIKEMEEKIKQMEVEIEEECMGIEDMGESILGLVVDIESGEISEEERKMKEEKKTKMEKQKKDWVDAFMKKKDSVMQLAKKKVELQTDRDNRRISGQV